MNQLSTEDLVVLAEQVLRDFPCGLVPDSLRLKLKAIRPQTLTANRLWSVLIGHPEKFKLVCVDPDQGRIHVWATTQPRFRINLPLTELRRRIAEAVGETIDLTDSAKIL